MKKYALKITRNTAERSVTVHPVTVAPAGVKPYSLRRPRPYYAESLQVFNTRREAEAAAHAEKTAAEFSAFSDEKLMSTLRADIDRVAKFGITLAVFCRITDTSYDTLVSYVTRGNTPNPRTVARFHLLTEEIIRVAKSAPDILPASGGCGNPRKGRGGNPDIWMKQPRFLPRSKS